MRQMGKKKGFTETSVNPFGIWCPLSDSNRPPTDYKSVALPDELKGQRDIFYPISQSSRPVLKILAFQGRYPRHPQHGDRGPGQDQMGRTCPAHSPWRK